MSWLEMLRIEAEKSNEQSRRIQAEAKKVRRREQLEKAHRRWYAKNRELAIARARVWQKAHPDRVAEYARRRRAAK